MDTIIAARSSRPRKMMISGTTSQNAGSSAVRAGSAALLLLVLTSVHHAYGAIVYETPWRLQVVNFAIAAAVLIAASLYLGAFRFRGFASRLSVWIGVAVILVFPVAAIGFVEGGYNHILKNIVFFSLGRAAELKMFPPPAYESPGDIFFELTGIAQFPLGIISGWYAIKLLRKQPRAG